SWCSQDDGGCRTRWSAVSDSLDWIGVNIYPYWNNVFSGDKPCNYYYEAAQRTMESHNVLMDLYSNIPVIVTEWGWPGAPDGQTIMGHANYVTGQQCSVCNNANQKKMVQDMIELNRKYQLPSNCFSAFREEWKGTGGVMSIETQWGICSGTPPYNCMNSPN
ncbi:eglC, partial [Acrasis kona]